MRCGLTAAEAAPKKTGIEYDASMGETPHATDCAWEVSLAFGGWGA